MSQADPSVVSAEAPEAITERVRERYAAAARRAQSGEGGGGYCGAEGADTSAVTDHIYTAEEVAGLPEEAVLASLGCGNPTALIDLHEGEMVLDLGSGGGIDVLLSARRVGPTGFAYGLDMTDEMLQLANANKQKAGVANATFLKGSIDSIPLPDSSVDVVISNCVINLAEDKGAVIGEAFRVLRPGGLFAVADMVELDPLAPELKKQLDSWAGCISGTIPIDEYRVALVSAGFADTDFQVHSTQSIPGVDGKVGSAYIRARKPARE